MAADSPSVSVAADKGYLAFTNIGFTPDGAGAPCASGGGTCPETMSRALAHVRFDADEGGSDTELDVESCAVPQNMVSGTDFVDQTARFPGPIVEYPANVQQAFFVRNSNDNIGVKERGGY